MWWPSLETRRRYPADGLQAFSLGFVFCCDFPERLNCDGRTHLSSDYPLLAQALEAQGLNFSVPDLRGRTILGRGSRPVGNSGGQERVTLQQWDLPVHSHVVTASSNAASSADPTNNMFGLGSLSTSSLYASDFASGRRFVIGCYLGC